MINSDGIASLHHHTHSRWDSSLRQIPKGCRPYLRSLYGQNPLGTGDRMNILNTFHAAGVSRRQVKKLHKSFKNVNILKFGLYLESPLEMH